MDLNEAWKKLGEESIDQPDNNMDLLLSKQPSHSLVATLKKGLGIKMLWIVLFIVLLTTLMIINIQSNVTIFLGLALLYMIAGLVLIYPKYRQFPEEIDLMGPSLEVLKKVRKLAQEALQLEGQLGKWFMPIFPLGGFFLALSEEELTWEALTANPLKTGLIILGAIVIGYFANKLGDKMNDIAFGKDLRKLDEIIEDLEE